MKTTRRIVPGDVVKAINLVEGQPKWLYKWCNCDVVQFGKHKGCIAIFNPNKRNDYWFLNESNLIFKDFKSEQLSLF